MKKGDDTKRTPTRGAVGRDMGTGRWGQGNASGTFPEAEGSSVR